MINLDAIETRLDAGQYSPIDKAELLAEVDAHKLQISQDVMSRIDRGFNLVSDLRVLFELLEGVYSGEPWNRQPGYLRRKEEADKIAADLAVKRVQDQEAFLAKAEAEKQQRADLLATAQTVRSANEEAADAQRAIDRLKEAQKQASEIAAHRLQVSNELLAQVNLPAVQLVPNEPSQVVEPQNQEAQ